MINQICLGQRSSFDVFRSNICHLVKDMGDIDFIIDVLENDEISLLYEKKWYLETFYLLAMIDYLSNINQLPLCSKYNDIRKRKLQKKIYPQGVILKTLVLESNNPKVEAEKNAILEFKRFNIIECEVRDVV